MQKAQTKRLKQILLLIGTLFICFSCSNKNKLAENKLHQARSFFQAKLFKEATETIDSLNKNYPTSIDARKKSLKLLDSVRYAQSNAEIINCDSAIHKYKIRIEQESKKFTILQNKKYKTEPIYLSKKDDYPSSTHTSIHAGTTKEGTIFIESRYVGKKENHNQIIITNINKESAQTLPETNDGFNYNFSNLGKNFEIIRFAGKKENGVSQFIADHKNQQLTVTLNGNQMKKTYKYNLSTKEKQAIAEIVPFASLLRTCDSISTAREKAKYKIYYLTKKNQQSTINTK